MRAIKHPITTVWICLAVAVLAIVGTAVWLTGPPALAQSPQAKETAGLTLTSPEPGKLVIAWDAASPAPEDYRVMWAKSDEKFPSFKEENTDEAGNAYPTGTSHTVTGLPEGEEYKVRVRARYGSDKAGPFSGLATVTISSTPEPTPKPTEEQDQGKGSPSREGRATEPPAKPVGLVLTPSHDNVVLAWTDPGDSTITGYQILRGPDAANLAVLTTDTGDANNTYTDDSVAAETTYVYAVRARNAHGLSPQSEMATVTTPAAAPPAKPTGLITGANHNSVLLSWTNPDDEGITGYQVLRGADSASLTVLVDDTGSGGTSYIDNSVAAETTYAYAIRARNAQGLSPQSDSISVTTLAAPAEEEPEVTERATMCDVPTLTDHFEYWSTTVTIAKDFAFPRGLANAKADGYSHAPRHGSISDRTFTLDGTVYTVFGVYVARVGRGLVVDIHPELPHAYREVLRMHVCDRSYSLAGSTLTSFASEPHGRYTWSSSGQDWNDEDTRVIRLSLPTDNVPRGVTAAFDEDTDRITVSWQPPFDTR